MIIFKEVSAITRYLEARRQEGLHIGFVPTMGALHEGHLSLVRRCRGNAGITVCSIFVNPTQFNDAADFAKYPVTIASDIRMLENEGCDILFMPTVEEVYPGGTVASRHYDLGYLETVLEGSYRPGHFQGVCQVVHRLLEIVAPHSLYLGQKDFQQCMVLKKLVELLDLRVEVVIGETLREPSGLAMSSRNLRLSDDEKRRATAIYQSLLQIKQNLYSSTAGELAAGARARLLGEGFGRIDYVAIADARTLQVLDDAEKPAPSVPLVALVAAFMGEVRLIDNMLLN